MRRLLVLGLEDGAFLVEMRNLRRAPEGLRQISGIVNWAIACEFWGQMSPVGSLPGDKP